MYATTTDPEYFQKSNYRNASDYYAAEDAREEWEEMKRYNARLIDEVNRAEAGKEQLKDASFYLIGEIEKLQEEVNRLSAKCERLEEYSAEQFNKAVSLQQDLDLLDKMDDEFDFLDNEGWEAY